MMAEKNTKTCCGSVQSGGKKKRFYRSFITGAVKTAAGEIPVVSTDLTGKDRLGIIRVRFGLGRDNYKVKPGLYAAGTPDRNSHVFVSANYKYSFDVLRRELAGLNAWILVLDTRGINVWCAAGKGTFGTFELVRRMEEAELASVVSHRRIIVPQLGAPGVSAHRVQKATGFKVVYGPVEAYDIKEFCASNLKASPSMREVRFSLGKRIALVPMELFPSLVFVPVIFAFLCLVYLIKGRDLLSLFVPDFAVFVSAIIAGTVFVQVLLPFIPARSFALKGWLLGAAAASVCLLFTGIPVSERISYFLLLPPLSSFLALNFTGASTYTSLSGVVREMRIALPLIIVSLAGGIVLKIIS